MPAEAPKTATFFILNQKPIRAQNRASKREYESLLFRPIVKIRRFRGYFETEPDTGFFLIDRGVIGAQIEPGWDEVGCRGILVMMFSGDQSAVVPFGVPLFGPRHNSFAMLMMAQ